jgi:hypothetical protein
MLLLLKQNALLDTIDFVYERRILFYVKWFDVSFLEPQLQTLTENV